MQFFSGSNLLGNIHGPISGHVGTLNKVYEGNTPSLHARALIKIAAGATSASFAHGLGFTPAFVNYSNRNILGSAEPYTSTVDQTTVTLSISTALAYDAFFDVEACAY